MGRTGAGRRSVVGAGEDAGCVGGVGRWNDLGRGGSASWGDAPRVVGQWRNRFLEAGKVSLESRMPS